MATTEAVDVVMPQMGVSVSEGTVTKWLKQEGETIEADESLLEISTDKVDTEVPSPASGVVTQILVQEGETVEVGTKLAVIGGEAGCSSGRRAGRLRQPRLLQAPAERRRLGRRSPAPAPRPRLRSPRSPAVEWRTGRKELRLAGRGADRGRARRRRLERPRNRPRRPRDQEGHPQLRRVGRSGRSDARRGARPCSG